jgi:hypothetical protein
MLKTTLKTTLFKREYVLIHITVVYSLQHLKYEGTYTRIDIKIAEHVSCNVLYASGYSTPHMSLSPSPIGIPRAGLLQRTFLGNQLIYRDNQLEVASPS